MIYLKDAKRGRFYKLAKPDKTTGKYIIPLWPVEQWEAPRSRRFISISFPNFVRLQYLGYMAQLEPVSDATEAKRFLFGALFSKTFTPEDAKKILKAM